jgi:Rrf2 family transcriptional regulator, iron-sulfur cluster assembly transcription factor
MLSNTSKYAIRAMIYLALCEKDEKKGKIGIKKISESLDIPAPFLAKILQILAKSKILSSSKGPNGGFTFNKLPGKTTLFDIVTIIDGKDIFDQCLLTLRPCNEENIPCPLHKKYTLIREETEKLFKEQDIESLANDIRKQEQIFAL